MIERYTRPEMGQIWSDENKYRCWWQVEREVCRVQHERGLIPDADWQAINQKADFSVARILEIEVEVKHDVIAFLSDVAEHVGPASRFIHKGMTSSDLLDTALALQLREAGELILKQIIALIELLSAKARQYKEQLMIGRTHGIHAEPISFGLKFLIWREELKRQLRRFQLALEDVKVGKISGAVGTYQHIDPEVEIRVCENLGLSAAPVSNQIVQRDRHAFFVATLAVIGASLEKIATEIRHLQRTEVLEAEEFFSMGQKGSSAMPHKRNPILTERICGMARLLRGYAMSAMENVALWHERDISHSSAERVLLPDSCITIDFILAETIRVLQNLLVYPENMRKNLERTGGLIFSQELLLALVAKGLTREAAYALVQKSAMEAWNEGADFKGLILADPAIGEYLDYGEIKNLFNYAKVLRCIDVIYQKLGD
ncbi:adenylosuccinate lyase [bacterium]|nr:adenylosuccinate lyase [bacterium]MBU1633857.1 adenylosuccinate lyase [bacterium]MBU1872944.1 adenylosuccinate lyase [bacterium]